MSLVTAAALALLALLIRAAMLGPRFPYIDDLLQLYAVTRPDPAAAARAMAGIGPLQPPLDYAAGFLAARLGGDLLALRLLPLAWGVLAVAAAVRLGTRRGGPALGAWWGGLLALSMPLVSFSVTLRPYSLAVLLGVLSWSALDELLESGRTRPYAWAQSLFQLAYPHAWLAGLAQLAYTALARREAAPALARALVPSWLTLGAWLAGWHLLVPSAGGFHYEVPASAVAAILKSFSQAQGPGLLLIPLLAAAGGAAALRPGPLRGFAGLAALSFAAPLAAVFAVHRLESVVLLPRHALPLLPAYLGLAAAGCASVSGRAGRIGTAVLAGLLAWAALDPLTALARRELALSAYLAGFAAELDRRAAPGDALVFADPNTGATLLHAMDRGAFDALEGVVMREGFALFRFPARLAAGPKRLEAYTLCAADASLATTDAARLRALRAASPPSRRVWLVSMDGLNAVPRERPFDALGEDIPAEGVPGLSLLR